MPTFIIRKPALVWCEYEVTANNPYDAIEKVEDGEISIMRVTDDVLTNDRMEIYKYANHCDETMIALKYELKNVTPDEQQPSKADTAE